MFYNKLLIPALLISYGIIFVGVAVGGGWQALVAYINLGSYYVFGLPLGYLLGYKANFGVTVNCFYCTTKLLHC